MVFYLTLILSWQDPTEIYFQTPARVENTIPLEFFIKRSLEAISYEHVSMFRISFFEFHPSHCTMVSAGNQISREEVERLYNKKRSPHYNSLQYELDSFYEKCLMNSVGTDIVHFFQTKLLTVDQYLSCRENFIENEGQRCLKRLRKNKRKLGKRLKLYEQHLMDTLLETKMFFPASAAMQKQLYFDSYHIAKDEIDEDFKLSSDLGNILEYNMYNGFRATWEFDLQNGKPNEEKIGQTINLNKSKLLYPQYWDGWEQDMRTSLIEDLNLRLQAKPVNS